jgi:hypothetical protein
MTRETSSSNGSYNYFELDGRAQSLTGVCVPSRCSPLRAPLDGQYSSRVVHVCSRDTLTRSQRECDSEREVELLCSDGITYSFSVADQSPDAIVEVETQVNSTI